MKNDTATEHINRDTINIDLVGTYDILTMINKEDQKVALAVEKCIPEIAKAVDIIVRNFMHGGRLLYVGAGTSGRLGVLDASECPPTFNTPPEMIQGIIAGGDRALKEALEGAEDSEEMALKDFDQYDVCDTDTIVGISASGNPKYLLKFLQVAKIKKCKTIVLTSNPEAKMKKYADCFICVETGAEVISGSTRMKAGTAQKMVLNMLTTASMVKIGKTYHNLMIDVKPTNEKLKRRAITIVSEIAECKELMAKQVLEKNGYKIKHAVLNILYDLSYEEAEHILADNQWVLRRVLEKINATV